MLLTLAILAHGNVDQHEGIMDTEMKAELDKTGLFKTRVIRDVGDPGAAFDWEDVFRYSLFITLRYLHLLIFDSYTLYITFFMRCIANLFFLFIISSFVKCTLYQSRVFLLTSR